MNNDKIDKYAKLTYHTEIRVSSGVKKQLEKVLAHIRTKFDYWCDLINFIGLIEARKYKGFHDEPLKGKLKGMRSVRLSKSYSVISNQ